MAENSLAEQCIRLMLRPVVRFCLRRSIKVQTVIEACKHVFIEVAVDELEREEIDISISRLSVTTGLHRRDVSRIYKRGESPKSNVNLINKVIGQWTDSAAYQTDSGNPRVLTAEGDNSEFALLVRQISLDVNPYTILFELERIGAIARSKNGVRLASKVYNPRRSERDAMTLLAEDSEDLMTAIEENVSCDTEALNLHIKTEYDNIPTSVLPALRDKILIEGTKFHERMRKLVSKYDCDVNPQKTEERSRVRVAIGSFSRTEILAE